MLPAIENGFTFIAFLMFLAGGLLAMEKYTKWKVFNWVPPLVWIYILNMVFCTLGLYNSEGVSAAYGVLKNNLLYAMIFVMLLRCDFRKIAKLSGRMIAIFLGCSITLALGFIVGFPIFKGSLGGGETICYSVWIALLLFAVKYAGKWNKSVKADTSKLEAVAAAANAEVANEKKQAKAADWIWLIGLALIVSALSQKIGLVMNNGLNEIGLDMFDKGTCTTLFVTVLGLVCAMTPLGKLPAVEDLSSVLLYAVVSLLATQAPLNALVEAPMWVVYGVFVLAIHVVGMYILSKVFHWDLCMVSTASVANIGGSASAPIIACAYDDSFAGIGVLMGVLGAAIGNIFGLGMGAILHMIA